MRLRMTELRLIMLSCQVVEFACCSAATKAAADVLTLMLQNYLLKTGVWACTPPAHWKKLA